MKWTLSLIGGFAGYYKMLNINDDSSANYTNRDHQINFTVSPKVIEAFKIISNHRNQWPKPTNHMGADLIYYSFNDYVSPEYTYNDSNSNQIPEIIKNLMNVFDQI